MLGAFGAARPRLTLSELSRASGLSLTTTHRIATDLIEWGALEEADGGYQIGLRLWEAARAAPRGLALRETALPALEAHRDDRARRHLDDVHVRRVGRARHRHVPERRDGDHTNDQAGLVPSGAAS
ncbi:helix-turn-helix domain-containing protein [Streptomyces sp. NPDC055059]